MFRKALAALCFSLALCLSLSVGAMAAPEVLRDGDNGNSDSLIWIKRPATLSATTSERTYMVTVAGIPGLQVEVFRKSAYDGLFYPTFQSGKIGASGLHVVSIKLVEGKKNIMKIYAETPDGSLYQVITIDITRLSKSQLEKINSLSVGDIFTN